MKYALDIWKHYDMKEQRRQSTKYKKFISKNLFDQLDIQLEEDLDILVEGLERQFYNTDR